MNFRFLDLDWHLLPSGAALCDQTLFVADLHLGKEARFQAAGQAMPTGPSIQTLQKLDQDIHTFRPTSLYILGDLWHFGKNPDSECVVELESYIAKWSCNAILIPGNHDRACAPLRGLSVEPEGTVWNGVELHHHPPGGTSNFIAGHLHPGTILSNRGERSLRLKCFWVQDRGMILPGFGTMTGIETIQPSPRDRIFALTSSSVLEITPKQLIQPSVYRKR